MARACLLAPRLLEVAIGPIVGKSTAGAFHLESFNLPSKSLIKTGYLKGFSIYLLVVSFLHHIFGLAAVVVATMARACLLTPRLLEVATGPIVGKSTAGAFHLESFNRPSKSLIKTRYLEGFALYLRRTATMRRQLPLCPANNSSRLRLRNSATVIRSPSGRDHKTSFGTRVAHDVMVLSVRTRVHFLVSATERKRVDGVTISRIYLPSTSASALGFTIGYRLLPCGKV